MEKFRPREIRVAINNLVTEAASLRRESLLKRQALRSARQTLADAEMALKETEVGLLADIMSETAPGSDKPRFSNDRARQAALLAKKKTDPDWLAAVSQYKAAREQAESLDDEVSSLEAELKTVEMRFWAECRVLESLTAEMNISAAALGTIRTPPKMATGPSSAKSQKTKKQG